MNDDDSTGMQNPIFKIMGNQTNVSMNDQQNPMGAQNNIQNLQNLNINSMMPGQMNQNQMGQMNMQNPMDNQQMDQNMQQMMNQMSNSMNNQLGMMNNPMGGGLQNPMGNQMDMNQMQMMQNSQMNPMQQMQMMNQIPMMQNSGMNPMQQMQMMNQIQMMQNSGMVNPNMMIMNNMNQQILQNMCQNNAAINNSSNLGSQCISSAPNKGINVIFRAAGNQTNNTEPIKIQCMPNDKVSDIIEKYKNKSGDRNPEKKFIFNAKMLSPNLTVSEAGIIDNSNIFVVSEKGIKGAN